MGKAREKGRISTSNFNKVRKHGLDRPWRGSEATIAFPREYTPRVYGTAGICVEEAGRPCRREPCMLGPVESSTRSSPLFYPLANALI